jgi:hypothetical protein
MRFTKVVWAASAIVGVVATYALSFAPTFMLIPVTGVQQFGIPAPVLAGAVYPGASLELIPAGVIVDILFWFILAAAILSTIADLIK